VRKASHAQRTVAASGSESPKDVALRLDRVTKRYGSVAAVSGLSAKICRGEFFTLVGPSGSGKSTTLLLIAGFETLTSGEIYLDGRALAGVPAHRRRIGVVFQSYALFPHLNVFENVAFGLRNLRWAEPELRAQVGSMLALVQLEGCEDRLPLQLSGGQQQRVALARALAFRPSLLLLDEPLGALDRKLREHMLIEFRRIHRALGTTMIYVTHDQEEALVMSDRIGVMNDGRLVAVGTPRELYDDSVDPFVADFLGDINVLMGTVQDSRSIQLDGEAGLVAAEHRAPHGAPVRLAVRPEKVAIAKAGESRGGWNEIGGRVEEVIYVGEGTKYRVRTCGGHLVRAKQLNGWDVPRYEVGADVTVSWRVSDARLLETRPP
jgi:putative spermidine/putrescine transport system ATP-binding protein